MVQTPRPQFASEQEEAEWRQAHREQLDQELLGRLPYARPFSLARVQREAAQLTEQTAMHSLPGTEEHVTVTLTTEDAEAARRLADHRGMPYESLLAALLHDALSREQARQSGLR